MSGAGSITAEPPPAAAPPASKDSFWSRYGVALLFLLPAAIFLGVWVVYPAIYTFFRSFFGQSGFDNFVGIDNYKTLFTSDLLLTAIKNNAIWVAVVPAFVTAVGLMFQAIKPMGLMLARLPVGPDRPGVTAGANFQLPYRASFLLPHRRSAWLRFAERLDELASYAAGLRPPAGEEVTAAVSGALRRSGTHLMSHVEPV